MVANKLAEVVKGVSNHYRVRVMYLLAEENDLTLDQIASKLKANYKTIHVHIIRIHRSGLLSKRYRGVAVDHKLTDRGKQVLIFLRKLE